jgi:hypothetical protein
MHPNRIVLGLTVGAAGALGAAGAWTAPPVAAAPAPGIEWRTDLEVARAEAKRTSKPLFITFR